MPALRMMVVSLLIFGFGGGLSAGDGDNVATIHRLYAEFVNQGNTETFDALVADDFVEHEELPGLPATAEGVKQFFSGFRAAFPDLQFEVEEVFGAGDRVVARFVMRGTHKGEFMGMAPTGKTVAVKAIDIFRFADGKITDHWGLTDTMAMMQQLGAMGEPE